ncbi:MAG: arsenic resistance N-acetyltransferase ArsN2 [Pseudomonadales bacterium]
MIFRDADPTDLTAIQRLLENHQLPASDCGAHLSHFVVAEDDNAIVAVGGFEHCGSAALIRSFAVANSHRGLGLAEQLFERVKAKALKGDIHQFYLLTTTASHYFERLGFAICDRADMPDSIKGTKQFSALCPASATAMCLKL